MEVDHWWKNAAFQSNKYKHIPVGFQESSAPVQPTAILASSSSSADRWQKYQTAADNRSHLYLSVRHTYEHKATSATHPT